MKVGNYTIPLNVINFYILLYISCGILAPDFLGMACVLPSLSSAILTILPSFSTGTIFSPTGYLSQKTTPIDIYKRQIGFQAACQPVTFGSVRPLGQNAVGTISSLPKRSISPLKEIRMASHFYIKLFLDFCRKGAFRFASQGLQALCLSQGRSWQLYCIVWKARTQWKDKTRRRRLRRILNRGLVLDVNFHQARSVQTQKRLLGIPHTKSMQSHTPISLLGGNIPFYSLSVG